MKYLSCILLLLFISCETVTDNNPVNNLKGINVFRIYADREDILNLINNRYTDLAVPAKFEFKGNTYKGRLRAAGAGSRYYPKFTFRAILENGMIEGAVDFTISAQVFDKTLIKTELAAYLYESAGFPVFYSEPVFVTINNENYGLYVLIERINDNFFIKRGIPFSEIYKVQFDSKFTFTKKNNLHENFDKEFPDDDNFNNLKEFIYALDTVKSELIFPQINKYINIDNYLKYHAVSTIRSDPDSYTNNFYFLKRFHESPFEFVPWDFDKTFTGKVGLYGYNELITKLLENDSCVTLYKAYMQEILSNYFTGSTLFPKIDSLYSVIKDFYKYDPYLESIDHESEISDMKQFITNRRNELFLLIK